MPIFSDGQDPLHATQGIFVFKATLKTEVDPFAGPTPDEVLAAAFRQYNPIPWVIDVVSREKPDQTPAPDYDPIPLLVGTKYEGLLGQSLGDVNPAQTQARMAVMANVLSRICLGNESRRPCLSGRECGCA
jgi:hypothetical protein